jgi:hypothetical protein
LLHTYIHTYIHIFIIVSFMYGAGVEPRPLLLGPFIGQFYQPRRMDSDDCGAVGGKDEWQG